MKKTQELSFSLPDSLGPVSARPGQVALPGQLGPLPRESRWPPSAPLWPGWVPAAAGRGCGALAGAGLDVAVEILQPGPSAQRG